MADKQPARISIELIPRGFEHLGEEIRYISETFPQVDTINVPDLLRFSIRSWQACQYGIGQIGAQHYIPHIRAMDVAPEGELPFAETIRANSIQEIVLITGDPPTGLHHKSYRTSPIRLLPRIRKELPNLRVYAAIDPYRQSFRAEADYLQDKIEAGFDGFFTQPIFDLRLMEMYRDLLQGQAVFWGIAPVTTAGSQNYWESKNNVVFPAQFEPTLEWNIAFARQAISTIAAAGDNCYIMPIRVALQDYLPHILL